ncbi:MAG: prepilin-type N-terminal cleavage/methylation domain-containing protein [Candidatus Hydrogenedentes bacterium]|nr:prepilin-type N-terminal cleavage/methylation domain-containing protein [Candidatus Hydrogenedentota bacterium]
MFRKGLDKRRGRAGFTLVEILVALTILAGSMFVLVNTHYSALNLHLMTAEQVDARVLLESTVGRAEMALAGKELSGGGDFGSRYPGYSWTYEALEMGGEEGSPLLSDTVFYKVTATLTGPDGESQTLEFYTFSNSEMQTVQQRAS